MGQTFDAETTWEALRQDFRSGAAFFCQLA